VTPDRLAMPVVYYFDGWLTVDGQVNRLRITVHQGQLSLSSVRGR